MAVEVTEAHEPAKQMKKLRDRLRRLGPASVHTARIV